MDIRRTRGIEIGDVRVGGEAPLALIAGPCAIESETHTLSLAAAIGEIARKLNVPWIFKASYDKANRTSGDSPRGPGLEDGLAILAKVNAELGCPILTDVHAIDQIDAVAQVADVLQIPAFLCRQTDLIAAAARSGKTVNIKKGQFLAPWDVQHIVAKAEAAGAQRLLLTERGASFGYNNLVSDMRALVILRECGWPVVFDATHSVQLPGGQGGRSGGNREYVPPLARAAVAVGIDALFLEVHDNPDQALSDGPNSLRLEDLEPLLTTLTRLDRLVKY